MNGQFMQRKYQLLALYTLRRKFTLWLSFLFLNFLLANLFFGATLQHWNAPSGNWSTASNWSEQSVPSSNANTILYFNVSPGLLTATSSNNNLGGSFRLNQLYFGSGTDFNLTGNRLRFSGSAPMITNNDTGGLVTIDNDLLLNSSLTITGASLAQTVFNGLITGNYGLNVEGGSVNFSNNGNSFKGDFQLTGGEAQVSVGANPVTINATGNNSYLGRGAINETGGRLLIQNTGNNDITISRDMLLSSSTAISGNSNLFQAGRDLFINSNITLDNGSTLKLQAGGSIDPYGATFTFGTNGGVLSLASPLTHLFSGQGLVVNTDATHYAIVQYASMDAGSNAWLPGYSVDFDIANGYLLGSGNLLLDFTGGAVAQYSQRNFSGSLTFSGAVDGNAAANSSSTAVGRLVFGDANSTTAQSFTINQGIIFRNANQVTTYLPTSGSNLLGSSTIAGNITIESAETAFAGAEGAHAGTTLFVGANASNTLHVENTATATFDRSFFSDPVLGSIVTGVQLNASTLLDAGGTLNFTQSQNLSGASYGSITVNAPITGQGLSNAALANQGESILNIQNSVIVGSNLLFTNAVNLNVLGQNCSGLRVQGSQSNVDALLTSSFLQTHILSPGATADSGTLTLAYQNAGSPTRSFTDLDAPLAASFIRLGFGSNLGNGNTPDYVLSSAGGNFSHWNGLSIKENAKVTMASDLNFVGAGSNTTFCLKDSGILDEQTFSAYFSGNAYLESGTITQSLGNTGALVIQGNAIKTSSGTLNLNGRIEVTGLSSAAGGQNKGIDIVAGTISQGIDNAIINGTRMTLEGGTYASNGHSQELGTLGTLTLAASSTLDFNGPDSTGISQSIIHFEDSSSSTWTPGSTLLLQNWSGTPVTGGGSTQIYFGSNASGLTANQLAQIWFVNPNGMAPGLYRGVLLANGELVPVPEISTVWGGIGVSLMVLAYELKRRRKCLPPQDK